MNLLTQIANGLTQLAPHVAHPLVTIDTDHLWVESTEGMLNLPESTKAALAQIGWTHNPHHGWGVRIQPEQPGPCL